MITEVESTSLDTTEIDRADINREININLRVSRSLELFQYSCNEGGAMSGSRKSWYLEWNKLMVQTSVGYRPLMVIMVCSCASV